MKTLNANLKVEAFEDRCLMSNSGAMVQFDGNVLRVDGTNLNDRIVVQQVATDKVVIQASNSQGRDSWTATGRIDAIAINGFGGNDTIDISRTGIVGILAGGLGNDVLIGGANDDTLYGQDGLDRLYGNGGSDWLEAGSARETAVGGSGLDWNAHIWAVNGTKFTDVKQTGTGSCVLMSTLASVTAKGISLANRIEYLGNFTYGVTLFDPFKGQWVQVAVKFDGYQTFNSQGNLMDPAPAAEYESWVMLFQRAYLQYFEGIDPTNASQLAQFGGEGNGERAALAVLGPVQAQTFGYGNFNNPAAVQSLLLQGAIMTAGAIDQQNGGHMYGVMAVFKSGGQVYVALYNPWGQDVTHNGMPMLKAGANDGLFVMKWNDFVNYFSILTVAR